MANLSATVRAHLETGASLCGHEYTAVCRCLYERERVRERARVSQPVSGGCFDDDNDDEDIGRECDRFRALLSARRPENYVFFVCAYTRTSTIRDYYTRMAYIRLSFSLSLPREEGKRVKIFNFIITSARFDRAFATLIVSPSQTPGDTGINVEAKRHVCVCVCTRAVNRKRRGGCGRRDLDAVPPVPCVGDYTRERTRRSLPPSRGYTAQH